MKTLVFLLLINTPTGQHEAGRIAGLDLETCDALQRAVWASEPPSVGIDEYGPIPAVDAACMPSHMLALLEAGDR